MKELWLLMLASCLVTRSLGDDDPPSGGCQKPKHALHIPGDATVTMLLDLHHGSDCSVTSRRGGAQLAAAAWTVLAVNALREAPSSPSIGLVVYDSCSSASQARKALVSAMLERECTDTYHLGVVVGRRTSGWLQSLSDSLGLAPSVLQVTAPSPQQVGLWLASLDGPRTVRVVASSPHLLRQFGRAAARADVCVRSQLILPGDGDELGQLLSTPDLVLVIGSLEEMDAVLDHSSDIDSAARWMFFPTDAVVETDLVERMPPNSVVTILRANFTWPTGDEFKHVGFRDLMSRLGKWALPENSLSIAVASAIVENVERLKISLKQYCNLNGAICKALPNFEKLRSLKVKPDSGDETNKILKRLKIAIESRMFGIHRVVRVNGSDERRLEEIAVYEQMNKTGDDYGFSVKWLQDGFKEDFFSETRFPTNEDCAVVEGVVNGSGCDECVNFARKLQPLSGQPDRFHSLWWNHEAWVAALVSIAALGVVCCAAVAIFIAVRILKGDVLEGHPGVSFLLLATVVLMYCSVLLYSFKVSGDDRLGELLCGARVTATCLSYALLFSIMTARGVMLASCDQDGGFMSHVNGYLQAVLCFFIAAVQVGLSLQFWLLSPATFRSEQCSAVREGYFLPLILCYDAFLLLVLVSVAPFIVHSKRNYREGAFFAVAVAAMALAWTAWLSVYLLAPEGWKDAAAAGGLAATATVVLVTVFIPRTYLMMTTIVRDQLASALPALARAAEGSVQNLHYRSVTSSQPLYDCVQSMAPDGGLANPNFYSEHSTMQAPVPGDLESRKAQLTADNTYERYDTPPAPDNITRF